MSSSNRPAGIAHIRAGDLRLTVRQLNWVDTGPTHSILTVPLVPPSAHDVSGSGSFRRSHSTPMPSKLGFEPGFEWTKSLPFRASAEARTLAARFTNGADPNPVT